MSADQNVSSEPFAGLPYEEQPFAGQPYEEQATSKPHSTPEDLRDAMWWLERSRDSKSPSNAKVYAEVIIRRLTQLEEASRLADAALEAMGEQVELFQREAARAEKYAEERDLVAQGLEEQFDSVYRAFVVWAQDPTDPENIALLIDRFDTVVPASFPASSPAPDFSDLGDGTCQCGGYAEGDHHFDRSLCMCGAMHYYCNRCGGQGDPCTSNQDTDPAMERPLLKRPPVGEKP